MGVTNMKQTVDNLRIIERIGGGWLGLSEADDGLRVGVTGSSEEQTKLLLQHSVDRWRQILQQDGVRTAAVDTA